MNTTAEIARFRTLAGQLRADSLRYTRVVRTDVAQYEIRCAGCGRGHRDDPFKFQSDATTAARTHAQHCLA